MAYCCATFVDAETLLELSANEDGIQPDAELADKKLNEKTTLCFQSCWYSKEQINESDVLQLEPASGYEDFYKPVVSIELRIDRFTEFASGKDVKSQRRSALTYIRGLSCQICAHPQEIDKSDSESKQTRPKYLAMFLLCQNKSTNTNWSCQIKNVYYVVSQNESVNDYVTHDYKLLTYCAQNYGWGRDSLITIDKLLDPEEGFIKDDTVILRLDVTAMILRGIQQDDEYSNKAFNDTFRFIDKNKLFSSSTEYPWDFVLIVGDERLYVQKNILSLHSEYFKEQFAKHKRIKRAILKNIDYDEFIELLSVIYPTSYPIRDAFDFD